MNAFTREAKIVRAFMGRTSQVDEPASNRRPILVFEAGAAFGKTELCRVLMRRIGRQVPSAYVDLARAESMYGEDAVPVVLAALADQLANQSDYGVVRFERLAIGLLARAQDLRDHDRKDATATITTMLRGRRDLERVEQIVADAAKDLVDALPPWVPRPTRTIEHAVRRGMEWLTSRPAIRGRILGEAQAWYGHQDRELRLNSIDKLVDINPTLPGYLLGMGGDGDRSEAVELLCGAFLADLREHFHSRPAKGWLWNAVILLDNVDTPVARSFVELLAAVQGGPRGGGVDRWDPLSVVTTSRGAFLAGMPWQERDAVREVTTPADLRRALRTDRKPTGWMRCTLPALTAAEVERLIPVPRPAGGDPAWRVAAVLHQLSAGNPGGVRMLVAALTERRGSSVEPELLLAHRREVPGAPALEDELWERLLVGVPEKALKTIVACAMGRNPEEARQVFARLHGADRSGFHIIPAQLWDTGSGTSTTLVRLLLLRRLARQTGADGDAPTWQSVCETLIRRYDGRKRAAALHYRLANGEVDRVASQLTGALTGTFTPTGVASGPLAMDRWLRLLDEVTAAPRHPFRTLPDPLDASPPLPFVRCLVDDLWAVADPACGTDRGGRYWDITSGYRALSLHQDDSCEELLGRIFHYERLAERWTEMPWPDATPRTLPPARSTGDRH